MSVTLFDFTHSSATQSWVAIDDRVMGGVSQSELRSQSGHAVFTGTVSPENNGGFCSVRCPMPARLSSATEHLWLEVRGEPRIYSLNVRMDTGLDGISYRVAWQPTTEFLRFEFPLTEFQATFRGREVVGAPALDPVRIRQIGLMIAGGQWGRFDVDIRAIGAL